jgi:hypothetical protein
VSRQRDDDDLLDTLSAALAEPPAEPSAAEVESLRRAVRGDVVATTVPLRPAHRGRRIAALAAAAAVLFVGAVVIRSMSSEPDGALDTATPAPLTPFSRAEASLADLRRAVATVDPAEIAPALAAAEKALAPLSVAEREQLEPDATRLLNGARAILAPATTTTTTVVPAGPPPTVDDKGGERDGDRGGSNSGPS